MSETYKKHIVSVNGSGTVSIPFEWSDPNEVCVYCYGSVGPYTGTLAGMIANGWVSLLGAPGGDIMTHFELGQRVWMVLSRQTALDSYSTLRDLLKAIDELRAEVQCTFRVPETFLPVLAAFPATTRKGKALVFDDNGNPALSDAVGGADVKTARDETLKAASDVKARSEQTAASVEDAKQWALKSADAYSRFVAAADAILKATDDAVVGCKQEIQRLLNNADVAGSEKLRELQVRFEQYVSTLGQAVSSASAQWDALLSGAMTSISEARETSVLNVGNSCESALAAMSSELNHALRVIRECVEAYGLELSTQTQGLLDKLREVYSQAWADSAKQWATKFADFENRLRGALRLPDLRSGFQTQCILGWDDTAGKPSSNAMYFDLGALRAVSAGAIVDFPSKAGTLALLSDISASVSLQALNEEVARAKAAEAGKVSLISHVTGTPNNEFDGYGYRGTLRNLGLFGGAVVVSSLGIVTRTGTNQNANVALWARILKVVNGAWVVAAQSKTSRKWNEVSAGSVLEFEMEHVAGVIPPRDDETIAIVWVNNANAAATVSNGALSFRTTSISGGVAGELPSSPTSGTPLSYSPVFHFKYAPFAGDLSDYAKKTDIPDVDVLLTEFALDYLPLSGGVMTGDIIIAKGSGGLRLPSGASIYAPDAGIYPIQTHEGALIVSATSYVCNVAGSVVDFNFEAGASGAVNLAVHGSYPSFSYYAFPYTGDTRTVATTKDLDGYAKKTDIPDVAGLQAELDSKAAITDLAVKASAISYSYGSGTKKYLNIYGYYGNLRKLGLSGGSITISSIGIETGTSTQLNPSVKYWARILVNDNGAWAVAYQSSVARSWDEVSKGAVLEFGMEQKSNLSLFSDETLFALVFVSDANAPVNSSTKLSFMTVMTTTGAISNVLPGTPTNMGVIIQAVPVLHFKYASYAGDLSDYAKKTDIPDVDELLSRFGGEISGSLSIGESLSVLPLGVKTPLGADAWGLHVSAKGGLQLFGTHFMLGTLWDDTPSDLMPGLKAVTNNISLYSTSSAAIGFDYANTVIFRTMPNDGSEATYKLEAWQWDDDSHASKSPSAGVKLLKPSQVSALESTSVLNMGEGDARWAAKSDLDAKANSADVVTLSGSQSITGYKSFLSMSASTAQVSAITVGVMKGYSPGVTNPPAWFQQVKKTNVIDVTTLKQGGVAINDLFVSKSDYDALLARVEALEAGSSGSGVTPTLSFPVGAADGTKWDSEVASASQNGTTVTLSAFPAAGGSYVVRVYGVDRTSLTASSEAGWLSEFTTNGSVFWDDDLNHGYVAFTVARNSEAYDRTATIRLVSSALPGEQYSIVVLQEGATYGGQ